MMSKATVRKNMTIDEAKQRALSLKSRFDMEFVVMLNEDEGVLLIRQEDDKSLLQCSCDCVIIYTTEAGVDEND